MYTGFQKLLEGPEFETLTLKQQIAPQYLPIWGEAEDFQIDYLVKLREKDEKLIGSL